MTAPDSKDAEGHRFFNELTSPGRASFDWAILCATLAMVFPVSGLFGVVFAVRSRRKGYSRWKTALAVALWCTFVGVLIRGLLHFGVFP
jgi:hypothetical protein